MGRLSTSSVLRRSAHIFAPTHAHNVVALAPQYDGSESQNWDWRGEMRGKMGKGGGGTMQFLGLIYGHQGMPNAMPRQSKL